VKNFLQVVVTRNQYIKTL